MKKNFFFFLCIVVLISFLFIWNRIQYLSSDKKESFKLGNIVKYFPFTKENSLLEWEEKILKGRVVYRIEKEDSIESYVRAKSKKAASALYYKTILDIKKRPIISWKWRADRFPKRKLPEEIRLKKEEDFAARIYIIFPAFFFTNSKAIEYIWAEELPIGTSDTSAYSNNIKILVLRSGAYEEKWQFEQRDIYEDYIQLFGEAPCLNVGAIAFMTDADSTKTEASAVYDEIKIGYKK